MSRMTVVLAVLALVGALLPASDPAAAHEPEGPGPGEPTEVLIKPADSGLLGLGRVDVGALPGVGEVVNVIDGIGVHVATVPAGTADEVAATLEALPVVAYAEPNATLSPLRAPDDPSLADQYALERINAEAGWARYRDARGYGDAFPATGGANIAVIDSGLDKTLHPEFDGKVTECHSWLLQIGVGLPTCQDNNVHGTHVSGIAAAAADNGAGIAGVAFDAQIQALQACTALCGMADVAAALVHAADNGADVVNMSLGTPQATDALTDALAYADEAGVLLIAAAGNDGGAVNFPAANDEVLAVAATDRNDDLAEFSSRGPEIDVAAPGAGVLSTLPTGLLYGELDGTSMAAPHVAGLGGLLMSLGANADQARAAIVGGADDVGLPAEHQGAGRIDVADSVELITAP